MDEPYASTDPISPEPIICTNCGAPIAIIGDQTPPVIHCPHCETDFFPAAHEEIDQTEVEWDEPADADDELDGMKIRKLVQLRRSAMRARTYALVVLICCLVMGGQLIFTDIQEVGTYGWNRWAILYAISAAVMVVCATLASRKAAALRRESNHSSAAIPDLQPQFDELSDGSQQVKNLEVMGNLHSTEQPEDPS